MTDISLNPQISARLRGVQQAWGHEAPGETLAVILDSQIQGWLIPLPQFSNSSEETAIKVRLKPRHVEYFTQISQFSGFSIADSVRSYLIKWLCSPSQVKVNSNLQPLQCTNSPALKSPKTRNKSPKTSKTLPTSVLETVIPTPLPETTPETTIAPKLNGRALLGGLRK